MVYAFSQTVNDLGIRYSGKYRSHIFVRLIEVVIGYVLFIGGKVGEDAVYVDIAVSSERIFRVMQTYERSSHIRKIFRSVDIRLIEYSDTVYRTVIDTVNRLHFIGNDNGSVDRDRCGHMSFFVRCSQRRSTNRQIPCPRP